MSILSEYGDYPFVDISVLYDGSDTQIVCENEGKLRHLLHAMKTQCPQRCPHWDYEVFNFISADQYPQFVFVEQKFEGRIYRSDRPAPLYTDRASISHP